jgi:hypothetical protein
MLRRYSLSVLWCGILLLSISLTNCTRSISKATPTNEPQESQEELTLAEPTATETANDNQDQAVRVKHIYKILEEGKSVDWSPVHDLILSSRPMPDEEGYLYYDVISFEPDGSDIKCLTCDHPDLPNRHQGNPAWHPSGDWIIFTAEKKTAFLQKDPFGDEIYSIPGKGLFHDLYVMDSQGTKFFKVHEVSDRLLDLQGLVHPQFSHSGDRVIWAQREGGDPEEEAHNWGVWSIYMADFSVEGGIPQLTNIHSCQPGEQAQFYETHGFSADDTQILYSANQLQDQPPTGMDVYLMDISNGSCTDPVRLTTTLNDWDEHAHLSPDQSKIAWISSEGFDVQYPEGYSVWGKYLTTELWIMNADGTGKQRLTYFNSPDHDEFTGGRTIVADSAWSPDGSMLVMCVTYADESDPNQLKFRGLYIIELEY